MPNGYFTNPQKYLASNFLLKNNDFYKKTKKYNNMKKVVDLNGGLCTVFFVKKTATYISKWLKHSLT